MPKTQSNEPRDAIDMLMEDHKRVQKLFKQFEKLEHDDAEAVSEVVETAIGELQVHSMLEEELFYPAVRAQIGDEEGEDLLNEAEVEHEAVDELIAKLQELEAGDDMYAAYFTVLTEYVKHHVKEEEKELFPKVRKLQDLDLQQLGQDMQARREELQAEIESGESETAGGARKKSPAKSKESDEEMEDEQEQADTGRTRH